MLTNMYSMVALFLLLDWLLSRNNMIDSNTLMVELNFDEGSLDLKSGVTR